MKPTKTSPLEKSAPAPRKFLVFNDFRFDLVNGVLKRGGSDLVLPPRALGVLGCLLERPGDVVSKDDIVGATWEDVAVGDQSLSEAVGILRRALDDDPQHPTYIQTVHRRGYRFIAPVTVEAEGVPPLAEAVEAAPPRWSRWMGLASLVPFLALALAWYINSVAPPGSPAPTIKLVARGSEPYACSLSPDGTRLAFITDEDEVVVKDLRVSQERIVASTSGTYVDWPPVWSPHGRSLAYGFFVGGDEDEWTWEGIRDTVRLYYSTTKVDLPPVPVSQVMITNVTKAFRNTPISEVARKMYKNKISHVPVVDEEDRLIGMVTDIDLMGCMFKSC